jgi:DNA repair protein RadC
MGGKQPEVEYDRKGHWERLRKRFAQDGLAGFHDYEVVELLLTLAGGSGDCKPAAKEAIKRFKSVRGVLDAPAEGLLEIANVGAKRVLVVKLVRALAERYYGERLEEQRTVLGSSQAVVDYLSISMRALDRECFRAVYLDAQNGPLAVETLFEGTLTSSAVYPREVFKKALKHNAAAVIFAHNHPSGCVEPSDNDRQITRDLVLAASFMEIRVLDHIVVGGNSYFSFADHGLIREYGKEALDFQESRRRSG